MTTTPPAAPTAPPGIDTNAIIVGMQDHILGTIRRLRARHELSEADILEIAQQVRIHLWQVSIPAFDPAKHAKMSTFLFVCVKRKISEEIRTLWRNRNRNRTEQISFNLPIGDNSQDAKIESLAAAIIADPAKFGLTPTQVKLLKQIIKAGPDAKLSSVAPKHWALLARIRRHISRFSIDDWDGIHPPPMNDPVEPKKRKRMPLTTRRSILARLQKGDRPSDIARGLGVSIEQVSNVRGRSEPKNTTKT